MNADNIFGQLIMFGLLIAMAGGIASVLLPMFGMVGLFLTAIITPFVFFGVIFFIMNIFEDQ